MLVSVCAAAALIGCGSGPDDTAVPVEYTLGGTAVKGPLNKAKVSVYKLGADGARGEKLAEGLSGAGGVYQVKYKDYTGLVLLEVEATDDTEMADEATGLTVKPVGLVLKAALQPTFVGTARDTKVHVNPLTTNAVEDAVRKGGLTAARIEQANKDLRESVGFDPLGEAPEFDESNKPKNRAGVVMAAISQLARDGDVEACKSASDTAAKVKCVVAELGKSAVGELKIPALQAKIDQVAIAANVEPPKVQPPTNTPPSEGTVITQAKILMAALRSNAKALDATDLSLQKELNTLQDEVDGGVMPVVDSTSEMLRTLDFGVQLLEDARSGRPVYSLNRVGTQYGAGCIVYTDDTFTTAATSSQNSITVGCGSYTNLIRNAMDSNVTKVVNTWRWRHLLLISPKTGEQGTYIVKTTARREYGTCQNGNDLSMPCGTFTQRNTGADRGKPLPEQEGFSTYSVVRGNEGTADFTRTFISNELTGLKLVGTLAPSLNYNVASNMSPVLDNGNGRYHEVALNFVKTTSSSSQRLSVAGEDAVIKFFTRNLSGDTVFKSSIGIGKDSFLEVPANPDARDGTEKFDLRIGYVVGNSAIRGQLAASDAKWDKSGTSYAPTKVNFSGRLERRVSGDSAWVEFLRGSLVMDVIDYDKLDNRFPESANNVLKMKATLNAVVTIPTRPVLNVNNLIVNSTEKGAAGSTSSMTGQYRQGSVVINFEGADDGSKSTVTLTSSEGVKLVWDADKKIHPMSKGDIKIGEFNEANGKLSYADGTFEEF
jgi:hypothetical protein